MNTLLVFRLFNFLSIECQYIYLSLGMSVPAHPSIRLPVRLSVCVRDFPWERNMNHE